MFLLPIENDTHGALALPKLITPFEARATQLRTGSSVQDAGLDAGGQVLEGSLHFMRQILLQIHNKVADVAVRDIHLNSAVAWL